MGHLTRTDFEQVIKQGGSVLHMGRHIFRMEDIPPDEQIENDHAARRQVVADSLDVQIANLTAQRAAVLAQAERDAAAEAEATKAKGKGGGKGGGKGKGDEPPADPDAPPPEPAA